jgi:uncharacterized membrane protein YebE (DUF533 family)
MRTFRVVVITAVLSLFALTSFAQNTPKVDTREQNQKERIKQGVKSGELTKKETAKLATEQAKIRATEAAAKADGKVTAKEKARIEHQQDKASKHIYKQKHDKQERK